jgi:spoIIIJ-associated protein
MDQNHQQEQQDNLPAQASKVAEELLAHLNIPGTVFCRDHRKDDSPHLWVEVLTEHSGLLIGERGNNLRALEHILRLLLRDILPKDCRCILDVNTYRLRRMEFLKKLSKDSARRAVSSQHAITLEPMTAMERRIVHMALVDEKGVETTSVGIDPARRVIIRPRDPVLAGVGEYKE